MAHDLPLSNKIRGVEMIFLNCITLNDPVHNFCIPYLTIISSANINDKIFQLDVEVESAVCAIMYIIAYNCREVMGIIIDDGGFWFHDKFYIIKKDESGIYYNGNHYIVYVND